MKTKLLFALFFSLLICSCSTDDVNTSNQPYRDAIIGEWQLKKKLLVGFEGTFTEDFNPSEVIYKFSSDGELEIVSNIPDIDSETLTYSIELDCLSDSCPEGQQAYELLFINGSKNELVFENDDKLQFGQGYIDGPYFVLERLP